MEHISDRLINKVQAYQPPTSAVELVRASNITLLVGITAAGKDTVKHHLLGGGGYRDIISHTTRPPRMNRGALERDGEHYHFIDFTAAERMIDGGEFIEAKVFVENIYGTSIHEIEKAHDAKQIAITDLEVQGVAEYQRMSPNVKAVFLLPPDYETWYLRLTGRYEDQINQTDLAKRMRTAEIELAHALQTDYLYFVQNTESIHAAYAVDEIARGVITERQRTKELDVAQTLLAAIKDYNNRTAVLSTLD